MKKIFFTLITLFTICSANAQIAAQKWVDSVFNSLTDEQRIAQLMVVRMSAPGANGKAVIFDAQVRDLINKYNIGSLCVFQGGPTQLANYMNEFQQMARTPIMMCIDGEYGLGMRVDSVLHFPYQISAGAVTNKQLIYNYGKAMGEQCKRMGIHVNYAPVVDVNNNPANPVIGFRSFGEDKYKVGDFGAEITKGMQDAGIMACAKHFPGHGDVSVDSHFDLPVINKTKQQLTDLELYPFQQIFKANVGSVMIAHLAIPAIDNTPNRPTSISPANVTDLLRKEMGYGGISFTDALEMKGVAKYYPGGEASVLSIIAGNDMLCLPGNVTETIDAIKKAIKKKRLTWEDIYSKTKKVLVAKYNLGLNVKPVINTTNLLYDINSKVNEIRQQVFEEAITALRNEEDAKTFLPLQKNTKEKIAYLAIGISTDNIITKKIKDQFGADVFYFDNKQSGGRTLSTIELLKKRYNKVIIGVHNYSMLNGKGTNKILINETNKILIQQATANLPNAICIMFGNPYALKYINVGKNVFPIAAYEDDAIVQNLVYEMLTGNIGMQGKLPVTVQPSLPYGTGFLVGKKKISLALVHRLLKMFYESYTSWMI
jgi:beta-glucosidase-like glycosyl hydrolase